MTLSQIKKHLQQAIDSLNQIEEPDRSHFRMGEEEKRELTQLITKVFRTMHSVENNTFCWYMDASGEEWGVFYALKKGLRRVQDLVGGTSPEKVPGKVRELIEERDELQEDKEYLLSLLEEAYENRETPGPVRDVLEKEGRVRSLNHQYASYAHIPA